MAKSAAIQASKVSNSILNDRYKRAARMAVISDATKANLARGLATNKVAMKSSQNMAKMMRTEGPFKASDEVQLRNFNQSFLANSNPDLQKGVSEMTLPGMQRSMKIPNAVLQKLLHEQAYNSEVDVFDKYLKGGTTKDQPYSSMGSAMDLSQKVAPTFAGEGSMDASYAAKSIQKSYTDRIQALGTRSEKVSTTGGRIAGGNIKQIESLEAERQRKLKMLGSTKHSRRKAAGGHQKVDKYLKDVSNLAKSTTSNLPIKTSLVKYGRVNYK